MGTAPILTASMSSSTALFQRFEWSLTASWRSSRRVAIWVCVCSAERLRSVRVVWMAWLVWVAFSEVEDSKDDRDDRDEEAPPADVLRRWVASWAWLAPTVIWVRRAERDSRSDRIGGSLVELGEGGGRGVGFGDDLVELGEERSEGDGSGGLEGLDGGSEILDGGGGVSEDLGVAFLLDDQAGFHVGVGHCGGSSGGRGPVAGCDQFRGEGRGEGVGGLTYQGDFLGNGSAVFGSAFCGFDPRGGEGEGDRFPDGGVEL